MIRRLTDTTLIFIMALAFSFSLLPSTSASSSAAYLTAWLTILGATNYEVYFKIFLSKNRNAALQGQDIVYSIANSFILLFLSLISGATFVFYSFAMDNPLAKGNILAQASILGLYFIISRLVNAVRNSR